MTWDAVFEERCRQHVVAVCAGDVAAWRTLLAEIAPYVETWVKASSMLRRLRLAGEDDVRAILVATIERLAAHDHDNLRRFLARRGLAHERTDDEVDAMAHLNELCDEPQGDDQDDDHATPLRAWLLTLLRFVERDHVRARLGWSGGSKRAAGTDAERLSTDGTELAARPPITDALTLAKIADNVRRAMQALPEAMRRALELWMTDASFDEIAVQLALVDAAQARALVRAGQARLREQFRGELPALFGT